MVSSGGSGCGGVCSDNSFSNVINLTVGTFLCQIYSMGNGVATEAVADRV